MACQRATSAVRWHAGGKQAPLDSSVCKTSRNHEPSAVVSFGLPDPLSFLVREHAMVAADRGQTSTGKALGSGGKAA
jgi:hypothetical protein